MQFLNILSGILIGILFTFLFAILSPNRSPARLPDDHNVLKLFNSPAVFVTSYDDLLPIMEYISAAAKLLGIPIPQIVVVPSLMPPDKSCTRLLDKFDADNPEDGYVSGIFQKSSYCILLSMNSMESDSKTLFVCLHELRHA